MLDLRCFNESSFSCRLGTCSGNQGHHSSHPKAFRGIFKDLKHSWIFIFWFYPGLNCSFCNLNISFVLLWICLQCSIVMVANAAVTLSCRAGCIALIMPLFGLFYDSFKWLRTAQRWLNCIISHEQQVHVNKPQLPLNNVNRKPGAGNSFWWFPLFLQVTKRATN